MEMIYVKIAYMFLYLTFALLREINCQNNF